MVQPGPSLLFLVLIVVLLILVREEVVGAAAQQVDEAVDAVDVGLGRPVAAQGWQVRKVELRQRGQAVARPAGAVALTTRGHEGRTYRLTGPQAVSYADVAEALAAATGGSVEYVDVPEQAAREALAASGMPGWLVEHLVGVFRMIREDVFAATADGVRELTGREPRGVADFARDHAPAFSAGQAAAAS